MRGAKLANEMLVFEESHLARYAALVEAEDLDCDLHVTRGALAHRPLLPCAALEADQSITFPLPACDVFFDETEAAAGRQAFYERKKDFPESIVAGDLEEILDPQALEKLSGMKGGKWGITYPAGHLWPYKLAAGRASFPSHSSPQIQSRLTSPSPLPPFQSPRST